MILGVGIDLLETARMARARVRHGVRFDARIFTEQELRDCTLRASIDQCLAARFAAKEACIKAFGAASTGIGLRQIEVRRGPGGRPELRLAGEAEALARRLGVRALHVSLTHQPGMAGAVVILEGGG